MVLLCIYVLRVIVMVANGLGLRIFFYFGQFARIHQYSYNECKTFTEPLCLIWN